MVAIAQDAGGWNPRPPGRRTARPWAWLALVGAVATVVSCNESAVAPSPDGGRGPGGLTPEQAAAVVARVGERTITLGEFAATLERMNQYDRLRYQTKEQRRKLLQELVDNELLAQEAKRRGLDQQEHVELAIRQVLRDAMLAKARQGIPAPAEIPAPEVRAYYDAHRDLFEEPERRRVAAIVMTDEAAATKVLVKAKAIESGEAWGELFHEHSVTAPAERTPSAPADLAGDLGIVGPVGDQRGINKKVPEAVQRAVFTLGDVGDVYGQLVKAEGKLFIVRLSGRTAGHTRSFAEAERSIRVRLLQEKVRQREAELVAELRKRFPVQIDDQALARVKLPEGLDKLKPHWDEGAGPEEPDGTKGASAAPRDAGP